MCGLGGEVGYRPGSGHSLQFERTAATHRKHTHALPAELASPASDDAIPHFYSALMIPGGDQEPFRTSSFGQ